MRLAPLAALAVLACSSTQRPMPSSASPSTPPRELTVELPPTAWPLDKQAHHALNRLAFGPSPSDVADFEQLGAKAWIERQLYPERIGDDAVAAKLTGFETLGKTSGQLYRQYQPLQKRAKEAGVDLKEPLARAELMAMVDPDSLPRQIGFELAGAKVVRAVESKRQLQEVLVDFWFNHFNVSGEKGQERWLLTSYERDAIRPHVFGSFRELLGATAHHPAMLFYLDNWLSTADGFRFRGGGGLNENYGRELLELHTVGVDAGYTQADVREAARAFTGWSIEVNDNGARGEFTFRPRAHDRGEKHVFGLDLPPGGGIDDGERVLDYLAEHPATARFIATKLCRKFVADDPPPALVARVADVFQKTHGDLRSVYAAIFSSPEFWSDEAYQSKTKTPLEVAISGVRALGGSTSGDLALVRAIDRMGEPIYRAQPPTGYPERAEAWVNAGALVTRINYGIALAFNRIKGTQVRINVAAKDDDQVIDQLSATILGGAVSDGTRATIHGALANTDVDAAIADGERRPADPRVVAGLLLGSPEFQKQ